jgi:hypothetical protein
MPDLTFAEVVRAENIERRRQKAQRQAERRRVRASGKRDDDGTADIAEIFDAYHFGRTTEAEFHAALRGRLGYGQRFIDRHAQEWRELLR